MPDLPAYTFPVLCSPLCLMFVLYEFLGRRSFIDPICCNFCMVLSMFFGLVLANSWFSLRDINLTLGLLSQLSQFALLLKRRGFWLELKIGERAQVRTEMGGMSSPGHEIQSFLTSYLVPHFSEVWKCGVVWQSKDIVSLSPSHEPFVILYLVLHFSEVWKYGIVGQSKDIVALFPQSWTLCHSLLSSTLLRGVEVWKSLTK